MTKIKQIEADFFPFPVFVPPRYKLASLPTPFRPLDRLRKHIGGPRIWLKCDDYTGSVLTGNKVRKLEFIVGEALARDMDALITCGGLQSNHCRATALVGAQLGLKVHLILRGEQPNGHYDGNLLLDSLAGADLDIYPPQHYQRHLTTLLSEKNAALEAEGLRPRLIPTGASDATGLWGYLQAVSELQQDFEQHHIEPSAVICATGSGGTQAGLSLGFAVQGANTQVIGMAVCDDTDYFYAKLRADMVDWFRTYTSMTDPDSMASVLSKVPIHVNDAYIGPGYAKGYNGVFETIKLLARLEGVVLDPVYTGKAFYGLLEEIKQGRFKHNEDLVFIHTGGIFGLFPYRNQLSGEWGKACL